MPHRRLLQALSRAQRPGARQTRGFATSSPPQTELQNGLPLLFSTLWRCATRYDELEQWEAKELVPSTLSMTERHKLFMILNTPPHLDFEAEDFLTGAKDAMEKVIRASKTREFAQYATGEITESSIADAMKEWCTPRGLKFHEDAVKKAVQGNQLIVEAEHVEVESAQIQECVYGQVTEKEFEEELHGRRRVINEITENASLERLFVSVKLTVHERLRRERINEEVQVLEQTNVYYAVFASNVTSPDVLDWGVVANVLGNTVRSKEISRTEISSEDPPTEEKAE
ncbi:hypothetical protein Poli38472_013261 [Pythium oligandrum]|uniref:Uncharacterized protein n=1 Tax=Pythium oligandrum TaxID=41045 RepID=A0A8K1C2S1_PYTOL|nr:hypothetical protein Poli38472_013261 [Pythium oligandrum]|eukprot:TMW55370.1 hypothetical protein Poli38472_013261 [Pythium oligandrum]